MGGTANYKLVTVPTLSGGFFWFGCGVEGRDYVGVSFLGGIFYGGREIQ